MTSFWLILLDKEKFCEATSTPSSDRIVNTNGTKSVMTQVGSHNEVTLSQEKIEPQENQESIGDHELNSDTTALLGDNEVNVSKKKKIVFV